MFKKLSLTYELKENVFGNPLLVEESVFVATRRHLWKFSWRGELLWKMRLPRGTSASPVYSGGALLLPCEDGAVHFFSPEDGALLSSTQVGLPCGKTVALEGELMCVGAGGTRPGRSGALVMYQGSDELWRAESESGFFATPVITESTVVCANRDGTFKAFSRQDGTPVWSVRAGGEVFSRPVPLEDGGFLLIDGRGYPMRVDGRGETVWTKTSLGKRYGAPGAVVGEKYFFHIEGAGSLVCRALSDGSPIWTLDGSFEKCTGFGPPLITTDRLVAGRETRELLIIDLKNGSVLQSIEAPHSNDWNRPQIQGERLAVTCPHSRLLLTFE